MSLNKVECRTVQAAMIHKKYLRKRGVVRKLNQPQIPPVVSDDELLKKIKASKNGGTVEALWSGDISGYNSQSEADIALCNILAFWTGRNAEQMDRLFRASGLMREKWDRPQSGSTYGSITVQKAIDECQQVYQPSHRPTAAQDFPKEPKKAGEAPPTFDKPPEPLEEQCTVNDFDPNQLGCVPEMQDMLIATAKSIQVPYVMPLMVILGVMAISVQKNFQVELADHRETLNLYLFLSGLPSERKSAVLNLLTKVLYDYEVEVNKQLAPEVEKSNTDYEVLIMRREELKKKASKTGNSDLSELDEISNEIATFQKKHFIKLAMDDCTVEALTIWMEENDECMGLLSTEGGPIQNMCDKYKSSSNLDSTYLKLYSGDPYNGTRVGRKNVNLSRPRLTMCVAGQPFILQGLMGDKQYVDTGMMSRFLFGMVNDDISQVGNRTVAGQPIPYEVKAAYENKVVQLLNYAPGEMQTLKLSSDAFEAYTALFNFIEPRIRDDFYFMQDWAGKLPGQALRIAGILHCFSSPHPAQQEISQEVMGAAVDLAMFFLHHAAAAYGIMGSNSQTSSAKYVLKKVQGMKQITKRELFNLCRGRFKKVDELEPVIATLIDHNFMCEYTPASKGAGRKPSPILYINQLSK